jgi:hypothetical protein
MNRNRMNVALLATIVLFSGLGESAPVNPVRLSLVEASTAVCKEILRLEPDMNPSTDFPIKEITTDEMWTRLHAQLFVVTDGIYLHQAYIILDQKVSPLGVALGGSGIMSMCVVNLDKSSQPQLLFTYSWGSGIHRSIVGIWTEASSWIDAKPLLGNNDLSIEKIDDQHIRLNYGTFDPRTSQLIKKGDFGAIHFTSTGKSPQLDIIPDKSLPKEIQDEIWNNPTSRPQ